MNRQTIKILLIAILSTVVFNACTETKKKDSETTIATTEKTEDDIVKMNYTNNDGQNLEVSFNNMNGTATFNFEGEVIELNQQKAASGVWYKNDQYELRGKGNDIELRKDGDVVFEHEDVIVKSSLKDKDGQTLDMVFNNTTNEAKIYLNGGAQIELVGQKPASGIWYKNDEYELRGKGESVELTKNGETVFKTE